MHVQEYQYRLIDGVQAALEKYDAELKSINHQVSSFDSTLLILLLLIGSILTVYRSGQTPN